MKNRKFVNISKDILHDLDQIKTGCKILLGMEVALLLAVTFLHWR